MEVVDNAEKKVRVERLVKSCEGAMTKSFGKQEQLYSFADKNRDLEALKSALESWLSDKTAENDEVLKKTRECIDGRPETGRTSSFPSKPIRKPHLLLTSKTSTSRILRTSSQRQRELLFAKHRREEIERQNESMLPLAQQK